MSRVDLTKPHYDQSTFVGRYRYFFGVCDPLLLFKSNAQLEKAKDIVMRYTKGENFPGMSEDEIWEQKRIYDSAYHPVTETKVLAIGRMSAQMPINTLIMGAMLVFYKGRKQVLFWQWVNQSFNAIVNQCNSSEPIFHPLESFKSYGMAVTVALGASAALSHITKGMSTLVQRLVPFLSVATANALNIPISRNKELREGIPLWFESEQVAKSRIMAVQGLSAVIFSRIIMQVPHMVCIPIVLTKFKGYFDKNPRLVVPFQFATCAKFLLVSTPLGCSIFPQKMFVPVSRLEQSVQDQLKRLPKPPQTVYFNKGL